MTEQPSGKSCAQLGAYEEAEGGQRATLTPGWRVLPPLCPVRVPRSLIPQAVPYQEAPGRDHRPGRHGEQER